MNRASASRPFLTAIGFCVLTTIGAVFATAQLRFEPSIATQLFLFTFCWTFPVVFGRAAYKKRPRPGPRVEQLAGQPSPERVHMLIDIDRTDVAELQARQLVGQQPEDPEAIVALARATLAQGNSREALNVADRALSLDPLSVAALHIRSLAHQNLQDRRNALADITQAVSISPHNPTLLHALAEQHLAMNPPILNGWRWLPWTPKHIRLASEAIHRGLESHPDHSGLVVLQARMRLQTGDIGGALAAAEAAVATAPGDPDARYNLGRTLLRTKDARRGVEILIDLVTEDQSYGPHVCATLIPLMGPFSRVRVPSDLRPAVRRIRRVFRPAWS